MKSVPRLPAYRGAWKSILKSKESNSQCSKTPDDLVRFAISLITFSPIGHLHRLSADRTKSRRPKNLHIWKPQRLENGSVGKGIRRRTVTSNSSATLSGSLEKILCGQHFGRNPAWQSLARLLIVRVVTKPPVPEAIECSRTGGSKGDFPRKSL